MAPRTPICAQTNGTATIRAHPEGSRMAAVTPNHAPRKRGPKPKNPGVTSRERKTLWEAANRSLKAALKRPRRKGCNRRIMSTREAIIPLNENRAKRNKAPLGHRLMNRVSKKKRARPKDSLPLEDVRAPWSTRPHTRRLLEPSRSPHGEDCT